MAIPAPTETKKERKKREDEGGRKRAGLRTWKRARHPYLAHNLYPRLFDRGL